jgi:RNA ligase (TIGR02306 family)
LQSRHQIVGWRQSALSRNSAPSPGADHIELAIVDGWNVIVKKGEYKVGDLAIDLEIDSWVPNTVAPFLTREGKEPREYKGVAGERLRSMRMRGQLSQGLLLSTNLVEPEFFAHGGDLCEEMDLTGLLGILKWEREIPTNLRGTVKGNFPGELRKTDQERVQNAWRTLQVEDDWEVTIKLDGSSMTVFVDAEDEFCSRRPRTTRFGHRRANKTSKPRSGRSTLTWVVVMLSRVS